MYYPSVQDVQIAVKKLNKYHGINITIINEDQLKFALEKPRMQMYDHEQYPELYQKAAVLMEGLTKIHALSDGNKRCAMLIAELLIKANGAELVLPLKTIQLSADTAMDDKDEMTEEIQQWFKIHIANNVEQLSILLTENMEEEAIITNLLDQEKHSEADNLVDRWMVFNSYPEHKTTWEELKKRWKNKDLDRQKGNQSSESTIPEIPENISDDNSTHSRHNSECVRKISDLRIVDHTLEELAQYEKLIKQSEELLADTKNVQLLMDQAYVLEQSGKFKEALEVQQKILKMDPTQHSVCFHMGLMYRYNQNHQKSVENFRKCLELNPTDPYARREIAVALMYMNRNREALKEINRSIEIESGKSIPHYIKSTIQARLGDFDGAEKSIRHALKKQPTNLDYLITLGQILLEIGEYDKAIEVYQKAENIEPKLMVHVHGIAYAYNITKNYDMAIKLYSTALQNRPYDSKALIYMGGAYSNKGEYKKALQYLDIGLMISPENKIGLRSMVTTLRKMGEYEKAIKYLDQYIELEPRESEDMQPVIIKSMILVEQNKIDDALELVEKIVKKDPDAKKMIRNASEFSTIRNSELFRRLTE